MNKKYILGCDEVGTGAFIGQLVVCGVRAPFDFKYDGLNDSKQLTKKKRELLAPKLLKLAEDGVITFKLAERSHLIIDEIGLAAALKSAYVEVFNALYDDETHIIVDGTLKFKNLGVDHMDLESVIKADGKFNHVMAASIIAKTYRDAKVLELHKEYPDYGWDSNAGYNSPKHKEGLKKLGLTPYHRKSYDIKMT